MRTRNRLWVVLGLVMVLVVLAAACGDDDDSTAASGSGSGSGSGSVTATTTASAATTDAAGGAAGGVYVDIKGFRFTAPKTVKAGSTVEVRNEDGVGHTVTADDGSFDSKEVPGGGEGSFTAPSTPGTYAFRCNIHSSMKGELVVSA